MNQVFISGKLVVVGSLRLTESYRKLPFVGTVVEAMQNHKKISVPVYFYGKTLAYQISSLGKPGMEIFVRGSLDIRTVGDKQVTYINASEFVVTDIVMSEEEVDKALNRMKFGKKSYSPSQAAVDAL